MKPDREKLLDEVLGECAPPGFKESLLQHTLLQVRRRSLVRRLNRTLLAMAVVAAVPLLLWKFSSPPPRPPQAVRQQPPFGIVTTRPLPRGMIVQTRSGTLPFIASSAATVAYVETGDAKDLFQEITDEQLFSLLAGRPAALVRSGPNQAELIFLHPEDQQGFRVP
jgi:hypothetical protein